MVGIPVDDGREGEKVFNAVEGTIQRAGVRAFEDDPLLVVEVVAEVNFQGSGSLLVSLPVQFVERVLYATAHPAKGG